MAVLGKGELRKIYSDLDFRFRKLTSGDFVKVYDENAINQSLISLFSTIRGERFFKPSYGSNIPFLLFEPFDSITANAIIEDVRDSIKTWEDVRIKIIELSIDMDADNSIYNLHMEYSLKSTLEFGNFELALQKT